MTVTLLNVYKPEVHYGTQHSGNPCGFVCFGDQYSMNPAEVTCIFCRESLPVKHVIGPIVCEWCSNPLRNVRTSLPNEDGQYPGYCGYCMTIVWSKPVNIGKESEI